MREDNCCVHHTTVYDLYSAMRGREGGGGIEGEMEGGRDGGRG